MVQESKSAVQGKSFDAGVVNVEPDGIDLS